MDNFMKNNMAMWDEMAEIHRESYKEIEAVLSGKSVIDDDEKKELGNVKGKDLLHVQCHIGADSISLAYEGANVTGTDFSERAIGICPGIC